MPIKLYQFPGAMVPPIVDARLYDMLSGGAVGIVQGCEITHLGGNQLQVSSGWGICMGRVFEVQQEVVNAAVSTDGQVRGRLLFEIDVTNSEEPMSFVTQAQSVLPDLIQENINADGAIYQMPGAEYDIDEISISNLNVIAPRADFTRGKYSVNVFLSASGWQGAEAPYTQEIAVEGMTEDWNAGCPVASVDEFDAQTARKIREELGYIGSISSREGSLLFICLDDKPSLDMTVTVPGI